MYLHTPATSDPHQITPYRLPLIDSAYKTIPGPRLAHRQSLRRLARTIQDCRCPLDTATHGCVVKDRTPGPATGVCDELSQHPDGSNVHGSVPYCARDSLLHGQGRMPCSSATEASHRRSRHSASYVRRRKDSPHGGGLRPSSGR